MNGYNGRILRVDLSSGQFLIETPEASFYRRYAGGGHGIEKAACNCRARHAQTPAG